jgi:glycosyltransferase involved in cell wall biosynthesis
LKENVAKIIAVIPAYNEEEIIEQVISDTHPFVDLVIVCDDGSTDNTSKVIRNNGAVHLRNPKKMGKGYALQALFNEAKKYNPDIVITLDADGQHVPSDIPKFISPLFLDKCDFVIGSRFLQGSWTDISFVRNVGLKVLNLLHNIFLKYPYTDSQCGFRAYGKRALNVMANCGESGYGVETEQLYLAMKHRLRMMEVPVKVRYRGLPNTSKMNSFKHGLLILKFVMFYSIKNFNNNNQYMG